MSVSGPKNIQNELLALKASLLDSTTRFSAYPAAFEQLKQMTQNRMLGLIFIQFSDLERVEAIFGFHRYEEMLKRAAGQIDTFNRSRHSGLLLPTMRGVFDDEFCVFVPSDFIQESPLSALQQIAERLYATLEGQLPSYGLHGLALNMGIAILHYNPFLRFERLVHRVVEKAAVSAQKQDETERVIRELDIRQILSQKSLSTLFHPIVNLTDFSPVGYEALTRGPLGTNYESPEALFTHARESKLSKELDRQCKLTAISSAGQRPSDALLFINTLPTTLDDPRFLDGDALDFLGKHHIVPSDVVWELTERLPIDDYDQFETVMKIHTELGYSVAIDDVGTGYSSIQTITHVRPVYLKIDQSMVRGVEGNLLKQELIASILVLGQKVNASVIAEGIEDIREFNVLKDLGVPMGQGFIFGHPSPGFTTRLKPSAA